MTRATFRKVLAKHSGVTQDIEMERAGLIQVDTPKGKLFKANGGHTIVEAFNNNGGQSWKPQAYADVARFVNMGLEECEDTDCDVCEEKTTEPA